MLAHLDSQYIETAYDDADLDDHTFNVTLALGNKAVHDSTSCPQIAGAYRQSSQVQLRDLEEREPCPQCATQHPNGAARALKQLAHTIDNITTLDRLHKRWQRQYDQQDGPNRLPLTELLSTWVSWQKLRAKARSSAAHPAIRPAAAVAAERYAKQLEQSYAQWQDTADAHTRFHTTVAVDAHYNGGLYDIATNQLGMSHGPALKLSEEYMQAQRQRQPQPAPRCGTDMVETAVRTFDRHVNGIIDRKAGTGHSVVRVSFGVSPLNMTSAGHNTQQMVAEVLQQNGIRSQLRSSHLVIVDDLIVDTIEHGITALGRPDTLPGDPHQVVATADQLLEDDDIGPNPHELWAHVRATATALTS